MAKLYSTVGSSAESGPRLALPPEQALAMPRQTLHSARRHGRGRVALWSLFKTALARLLLLGGTVAVAVYGIREMHAVMTGELTLTQWVFLVLFSLNFTWISFAGCQVVLGFLLLLKQDLFGFRNIHTKMPGIRTAVLLPVYNEDPARVVAAISAMVAELVQAAPGHFAFFILSDTSNPQ